MAEFLKYRDQRMLKAKMLEFLRTMVMSTNNGQLFILIRLNQLHPKASTQNSDSTSTDHSISDQECQ
jgi:hypothetical protein